MRALYSYKTRGLTILDEKLIESLDRAILSAVNNERLNKDQFMRLSLSIRESQSYMKYISFAVKYPKLLVNYRFNTEDERKALEEMWNKKRNRNGEK